MIIHTIGDPHLGRKFEVGVPLNRRGEREAEQLAKLKAELAVPCDYNIMMGDLFDNANVSHAVVTQVAEAYLEAAKAYPNTTFLPMAGNHDLPRSLTSRGAWLSFKYMLEGIDAIWIVDRVTDFEDFTCIPWDWSCSAEEQLAGLTKVAPRVYGHWDMMSFGGDDSHLCPTKRLVELGAQEIVSGHYHIAGEYEIDGVTVRCTGSMMPYTHGEDPEGKLYVTVSLEELLENPAQFSDKCVRVLLQPGEILPTDIDCRALTMKRVKVAKEELEIDLEEFDWASTMAKALAPLTPQVREFITNRLTT